MARDIKVRSFSDIPEWSWAAMGLEPVEPLFTPEELVRNENQKRAMAKLFVSGETVLVIGSGCSAPLKYPTWPALLSKLTALAPEVASDFPKGEGPEVLTGLSGFCNEGMHAECLGHAKLEEHGRETIVCVCPCHQAPVEASGPI